MANRHNNFRKTNVVPFHPDVDEGAALLRTPEARTSRAKRIQLERDHLRLQIKSLWHMEELYKLLVRNWTTPTEEERVEEAEAGVTVSVSSRIGMLKAKMDGHFKFLNKVIPDQASYQVDAQVETSDKTQVPNIRIVAFREQPEEDESDAVRKEQKTQVPEQEQPAKKIEAMVVDPHLRAVLEGMPWLR